MACAGNPGITSHRRTIQRVTHRSRERTGIVGFLKERNIEGHDTSAYHLVLSITRKEECLERRTTFLKLSHHLPAPSAAKRVDEQPRHQFAPGRAAHSLARATDMVLTVYAESWSAAAMAFVLSPWATRNSTACSRAERP